MLSFCVAAEVVAESKEGERLFLCAAIDSFHLSVYIRDVRND